MKLRIKKLDPRARLPVYASEGAACLDLSSIEAMTISAGAAHAFRTGLAFEVPAGHVMLVFSRSGHGFKHGVRLANCVGVIDSDYRGELMVKLHNDKATPFSFEPGDRIAQAMVIPVPNICEIEVVDELSDTERGACGFGAPAMRKRTKRKVVKLMNPITLAIEGATITHQKKLDELRVRELASIEAFAMKQARAQDWFDLRAMINVAREMGLGNVGPEVLPYCDEAMRIMDTETMMDSATEILVIPDAALAAIREVFGYHDLQRQSISRAEYERFIKRAERRVRALNLQPQT